jgi:hypothetical protein
MTRVRNFEDVRFGMYLVQTWYVGSDSIHHGGIGSGADGRYYSPYPMPVEDKTVAHPHASTSTPTAKRRKLDNGVVNGATPASKTENDKSGSGRTTRTFQEVFVGVGKGGEGARGRLWVCDVSLAERYSISV